MRYSKGRELIPLAPSSPLNAEGDWEPWGGTCLNHFTFNGSWTATIKIKKLENVSQHILTTTSNLVNIICSLVNYKNGCWHDLLLKIIPLTCNQPPIVRKNGPARIKITRGHEEYKRKREEKNGTEMRMLLPRSKSDKGKKRKDRVEVHLPVASSSLLSQRYCTFYFFHVMENKDLLSCSGFIKCEPWSKLTYTLLCLKWFVIILEQHPGVHARTLISYAGQYIGDSMWARWLCF